MTAEEFLPYYDYLKVYSHVQRQEEFEYTKTINKIRIHIHSSRWRTSEKYGKYMVSIGSMSNTCGGGGGNDPEEFLKDWCDYSKALEEVNGLIKRAGGKIEEEPQMRLLI